MDKIVLKYTNMMALILFFVLFLLFAACGDGTVSNFTPPEDKALISFVAADYSSVTKPLLENLVKDFESKYPNINVELQVVNWDILDGVYTTMISRNQPPDLLYTNIYAHFAKDGLLNDMEDILSPELKAKFYPSFMEMDRWNGVQYAVPFVASIRELYYNKDVFEAAGLSELPSTWSELTLAAQKIVNTGKAEGFGVDLTDNESYAYLSYFFFGGGGGWLKNGEWAINSPENVEGLTFLKQLYDKGLTDSEPTITTRDEKHRILGNDKLGMMISGNYFPSVVPKEFPGLKWGVGPIPVKDGQSPIAFGVHDMLMSFKTEHTNKEAISKFLDFLYDDAWYEEFILREGFLPVTKTVGDKVSAKDKIIQAHMNSINNAMFYPVNHEEWSTVLASARIMGPAVLSNRMSPQEALDQLQRIALNKRNP
jgi:multiple sugar transport system substrate-binding protein